MKRFILFVLVLCLVPVMAFALDYVDDFDIYASVMGMDEIKNCQKQTIGNKTVYMADNGFVGFEETAGQLTSVSVFGDGDYFLFYSVSAFCVMEGNTDHIFNNSSELFKNYLICRVNNDMTTGVTDSGLVYLIQPYEGKYMIVIQR